jgi:hypothetical protein
MIGAHGSGLRVCPQSWLGYLANPITTEQLKEAPRRG